MEIIGTLNDEIKLTAGTTYDGKLGVELNLKANSNSNQSTSIGLTYSGAVKLQKQLSKLLALE